MNVQPLNDLVLLRPVEVEEKTEGGIYLPGSAQEQPAEGVVEAKAANASDDVDIGDRVVYKRFSGEEVTFDGTTFRLVSAGDLLAKYVEADEIPE